MKKTSFLKLALIAILPLLFLSCASDSGLSPEELEATKLEKLKTEIIGKWMFNGENLRTANAEKSSIEFLADGKYILINDSGNATIDQYSFISSNEISLKGFGVIKEISLDDKQVSFKLSYQNKDLSITAQKAETIDPSQRTQLLCKKWKMMPVENGKDSLNSSTGLGVDSTFLTFYASGTYEINTYSNGLGISGSILFNWKWHDAISDRFVYWRNGYEIDENKYYTIIRELTATQLKVTELANSRVMNFTFVPAN